MSLFGLLLVGGGLGFLCWLLFALAIYALPVFVGLSAGAAAFHSGAGYLGAFTIALIAGGATFAAGKFIFARARSPLARSAVGLVYAIPAAVAGFEATLGIARIGTPSEAWCDVFAVVGGAAVAVAAWYRLAGEAVMSASNRARPNTVQFRSEAAAKIG